MTEVVGRTSESHTLPYIRILKEPIITVQDGATLKVLAISPTSNEDGLNIPIGYVSTKAARAQMLGEFSGEPTGEYMPCNAVMGWVGENRVYSKNVSTDTPLSGLRTVIAERRASRAVLARLR